MRTLQRDGSRDQRGGVVVATSEREPSYLLRTSNGRQLKLSGSAYYLYSELTAGVSAQALAQRLSGQLGREVDPAEVQAAYDKIRSQVERVERAPAGARPFGLWWRLRLLRPPVTTWLTRGLSWAFHPVAAGVLLIFVAFAFIRILPGFPATARMSDPGAHFWPAFSLAVLSMLAHELGHASACVRFGVAARDIGFGLYWIYPVFYSDVSEAWALTRRQRVVVDLAGLYFQLVVGAAYLELYRVTGWEPARMAFVASLAVGILLILPIFKFDGYWLLSDALGVVNLSRQIKKET